MNELLTAVSTVGFPIVCCAAMFWYIYTSQDKMRSTIEENTVIMEKMYSLLLYLLPDEVKNDEL